VSHGSDGRRDQTRANQRWITSRATQLSDRIPAGSLARTKVSPASKKRVGSTMVTAPESDHPDKSTVPSASNSMNSFPLVMSSLITITERGPHKAAAKHRRLQAAECAMWPRCQIQLFRDDDAPVPAATFIPTPDTEPAQSSTPNARVCMAWLWHQVDSGRRLA
jgi:hypothetical protein